MNFGLSHNYTFLDAEHVGAMTTIYRGRWNFFDQQVYIASVEGLLGLKPTTRTTGRVFKSVADEAGALRGPNLPDIIDSSRIDKITAVVVMRLPPGMVLSQYIEAQGRLDVDQTYRVLRGVTRALEACREQVAPHRGATPDRIWLCDDGTPILLGYGEALRRREVNTLSGRTANEVWWHTPPEVLRDAGDHLPTGENERIRSVIGSDQLPILEDSETAEVWNLGCLAYFCLEGHHPYYAKPNDHQHGVVNTLNDIRLPLHNDVSYLQPLIDKSLNSSPSDRYESPRALTSAFHAVIHPGSDEDNVSTGPQRMLPGMPAQQATRPTYENEQTVKRAELRSKLWRTTSVALAIALMMYAWLDVRRPRSLILTSDPIGIEIVETTGHLETSRGRTPIVLTDRRLNDPITLRTVGPGGHLGEPVTVLPTAFADLGRCVQAEIIPTFAPARPSDAEEQVEPVELNLLGVDSGPSTPAKAPDDDSDAAAPTKAPAFEDLPPEY